MLTIKKPGSSTEYVACVPFADCPHPLPRIPDTVGRDVVPVPRLRGRLAAAYNTLDWPVWGLTRPAELHVLLPGDEWATLRASLDADRAVTVTFGDGINDDQTASMYVVESVPVSDSRDAPAETPSGEQVLYWLTLSDGRYQWAQETYSSGAYTGTAPASWGALLSDLILQATGQTVTAATINALTGSYPVPSVYFSSTSLRGRNVCTLTDAVAAALNLRVHVALDGTVTVQDASAAVSALSAPVDELNAGGYRESRTAATLNCVEYTSSGVASSGTQAVSGGESGELTVWLPYGAGGWSTWATGYAAWSNGSIVNMGFAGFPTAPASALVDRFVVAHDDGMSWWVNDTTRVPLEMLGGLAPSATLATQNTDGTEVGTTSDMRFNKSTGVKITQGGGGFDTVSCIDASPTQTGVVNTTTQTFEGVKLFNADVYRTESTTGTASLPYAAMKVVPATSSLVEVQAGSTRVTGANLSAATDAASVTCGITAGTPNPNFAAFTLYDAVNTRGVAYWTLNTENDAGTLKGFVGGINAINGKRGLLLLSNAATPAVGTDVTWDLYADPADDAAGVYPIRSNQDVFVANGKAFGATRTGTDYPGVDASTIVGQFYGGVLTLTTGTAAVTGQFAQSLGGIVVGGAWNAIPGVAVTPAAAGNYLFHVALHVKLNQVVAGGTMSVRLVVNGVPVVNSERLLAYLPVGGQALEQTVPVQWLVSGYSTGNLTVEAKLVGAGAWTANDLLSSIGGPTPDGYSAYTLERVS